MRWKSRVGAFQHKSQYSVLACNKKEHTPKCVNVLVEHLFQNSHILACDCRVNSHMWYIYIYNFRQHHLLKRRFHWFSRTVLVLFLRLSLFPNNPLYIYIYEHPTYLLWWSTTETTQGVVFPSVNHNQIYISTNTQSQHTDRRSNATLSRPFTCILYTVFEWLVRV